VAPVSLDLGQLVAPGVPLVCRNSFFCGDAECCNGPRRARHDQISSLADAPFRWEDPLDLEGELSAEERMVRDTARRYAQDQLLPRILTAYREGSIARS
jgi:hypothetical protein